MLFLAAGMLQEMLKYKKKKIELSVADPEFHHFHLKLLLVTESFHSYKCIYMYCVLGFYNASNNL